MKNISMKIISKKIVFLGFKLKIDFDVLLFTRSEI